MLGFGRYNPMPFTLGGGESVLEQEHLALLDALAPGWDTESSSTLFQETYVDALAITMIWAINERLSNQMIPARMLENLATWERSCGLRPAPSDSDRARRAKVAAKLRASANNAMSDAEAVCEEIMGSAFVQLTAPSSADWITYWPGMNPGPPGFEWASNRARVGVSVDSTKLSPEQFIEKRAALVDQLDKMLPTWMSFCVGLDSAFIPNIGIVGQTLL